MSKKRNLHPRPPRGPTEDEPEAREKIEETRRKHNIKYGYTKGAPFEEGWGGPLNLTLINVINLTAAYREEKAREITDNIIEKITNYTGWEPEKRRGDTFLLRVTVREMYKLMAEGLPDITEEEKEDQQKINRRYMMRLNKIADKCREEINDNTYQDKIEAKRIKQ